MGNLPPIDKPDRIPFVLPTPEVLMDHHFAGQPVFPAVEAMEALARCLKENYPQHRINHIADARFEKFLPMDPCADTIDAFVELQQVEDGAVQATLLTRTKAPKAAFTRTKTHVRMTFLDHAPEPRCPPVDLAASLQGVCTVVEPEMIYRELVPFGPAFRNINAPLHISPDGALAKIKTPSDCSAGNKPLLGCGYALDAAFHAACVWAQRYHDVVAFPVAIDHRILLDPTTPSETYFGRVFPRELSGDILRFDILLFDQSGGLREIAKGVHMRDVSGGRLTPPEWLQANNGIDPLSGLGLDSKSCSVLELDAVADFADLALTPLEGDRYHKMGDKRRRSFLAARLALKYLYRQNAEAADLPADRIETVHENSPLPRIGRAGQTDRLHCSVSHDRRFAIAVADTNLIGVDVEEITGKALKSARLFMSETELNLLDHADTEAESAAVRVWSAKEAASKAAGINLAETWRRANVTAIGETESTIFLDGNALTARHVIVDQHLFTTLLMEASAVSKK